MCSSDERDYRFRWAEDGLHVASDKGRELARLLALYVTLREFKEMLGSIRSARQRYVLEVSEEMPLIKRAKP